MSQTAKAYFLLLDVIFLLGIFAYITLPVDNVPFHGDESTTIWMSEDYQTALDGDFAELTYAAPPRRTTEQHMRIITSNLSKIAMGISWRQMGIEQNELNEQWIWGADFSQNEANNSIPSPKLLRVTRLSSAWLLALSTVFIVAITRRIAHQFFRNSKVIFVSSWLGAVAYTFLYPAILLNGRRAMFEGGLLFGLAIVAWASIRIIAQQNIQWFDYGILGICAGLGLSTKHSATFTVVLLFSGLVVVAIISAWQASSQISVLRQYLMKISLATVLALLIFFGLNPLWWSNPLDMPAIVIKQRQMILDEQVTYFPTYKYEEPSTRIAGLVEEIINPSTQYYETDYWIDYAGVSTEIDTYNSSLWAGLGENLLGLFLRGLLVFSGIILLIYQSWHGNWQHRKLILLIAIWAGGMSLITLITVPLHWQRYYLPVLVPHVILMGIGGGTILEFVEKYLTSR